MAEVIYEEARDTAAVASWFRAAAVTDTATPAPLAAARISFDDTVPTQRRCPSAADGLLKALAQGDVVLLARDGQGLRLALHCLTRSAVVVTATAPAAADPERPRLTEREVEALTLAAKGLSAQEVATMLDVSIHTAHTHFKNAYRKLSVKSRGEAVFEATRLGLIAP